jgi:hypothetical protein
MAVAGFYGLRTEWWHFVDKDWQNYRAIPEIMVVPQSAVAMPAATPTGTVAPRLPSGAAINRPVVLSREIRQARKP